MRGAGERGVSRWIVGGSMLASMLLSACGGGTSGDTPGVANLFGTLPTCTIADGASSCEATVVWTTVHASPVQLSLNGVVTSTAPSGHLSPTVNFGSALTVSLVAGGTTVDPVTVSAICASTSAWNGSACTPLGGGSFVVTSLSAADGATGVPAETPITGTATQPLVSGKASVACHDADDASIALAATAVVTPAGNTFSVATTYAAHAMLPHAATCTLSGTVMNGTLASTAFGPVTFTTDTGEGVERVLAAAGQDGLPFLVDPSTGTATTPAELASHAANCFGAYDRHLGRLRTLCGKTSGGIASVWDIDLATTAATPVDDLTNSFANGNVTSPDVAIAADGSMFLTRGGLQADNTTNSTVLAVTAAGKTNISWDWGGSADYVARLLMDTPRRQLYAVTHLGKVFTISLSTLTAVSSVDLSTTVNDALLSNGQVVVAAPGARNLRVYDPGTGTQLAVPFVFDGEAATALALTSTDLVVATSSLHHGVPTAALCLVDPATYVQRSGPCADQTDGELVTTLAADASSLFGSRNKDLVSWSVTDLTTQAALASFNGTVLRLAVVHN